jgi:hypothetical protein
MNHLHKYFATFFVATAALLGGTSPAWAQVTLGAASDFAVLGGTAITCTSGSVVTGDVGVFPGTAFTNTGCTIAGATPPATNAAAEEAREDFLSAYTAIQALSTTCTPKPGNLAGENLEPGVYCLDAVAKAGTLTLTGNANGVWIFLVDGALTGTSFSVVMAGGGEPCNVFWAPTGAATMTDSAFKGNILAGAPSTAIDPGSVTLTRGSLAGRVLANVAVTMTGASVIGCDALSPPSPSCKPKKHRGHGHDKDHKNKCNQGVGNDAENCDPGRSNHGNPFWSNDERGGRPGDPGRKGGGKK